MGAAYNKRSHSRSRLSVALRVDGAELSTVEAFVTTDAPALPSTTTLDGKPFVERLLRNLLVAGRTRWLVDAIAFGVVYGVLLAYFRPSLLFAATLAGE